MAVYVAGALIVVCLDMANAIGDPLPPPFVIAPSHTDGEGTSATNSMGMFRRIDGTDDLRYFLGTHLDPGALEMDFSNRFTDGPGDDFAILAAPDWGPLADMARFDFFLDGLLQTTFTASLSADQLLRFDLPGSDVVANRIVLTNLAPDVGPGTQTTMAFDNAGVAHLIPEPGSGALLAVTALAVALLRSGNAPARRSKLLKT